MAIVAAVAVGVRIWSVRPPMVRRRVIVPLTDPVNHSIRGVLWRVRGPWLVFVEASLVRPDKSVAPMVGEVVIHRDRAVLIGSDPA